MSGKLWRKVKEALVANAQQTICSEGIEISFGEIAKLAESLAKGYVPGLYAIRCKQEFYTAIALLSCFCAGVTAIPLSNRYGTLHCNRILAEADADFLISDESGTIEIYPLKNSGVNRLDNLIPALIMYTSGTTGKPKGIMLSEENVLANVDSIADYFHITKSDRVMIARPLYHCAVLTGEFLISLFRGAHIVFSSSEFNPLGWANLIFKHKISVLGGTPTLFLHLGRLMGRSSKLSSLKKIVVSGERMTRAIATEIREMFPEVEVNSVYGLTEASPRVTALPPSLFDKHPESSGVPLKGVEVRIVNKDGEEAIVQEVGELEVKGDNVMLGYYGNVIATNKVLHDGWLRTGDMAYKDEKGLVYIKGRQDDMIIYAGMNIYPQEIEGVLYQLAGVTDVLISSENDVRGGQKIVMFISGQGLELSLVREYCKHNLPEYERPQEIHIVQEIKRNGSGKIIRNQFLNTKKE